MAAGDQAFRVFIETAAEWVELTSGAGPTQRVTAPDLKHAQRIRHGVRGARGESPGVILDVHVHIESDSRSARKHFATLEPPAAVSYAGTPEGLAGLITDIYLAGVADGVTLIPASPSTDVDCAARHALALLSQRVPLAA
ncbi:hypothetical protein FZI91_20965 [Mycobacterium sp. CBMA271]|uniref:hypothetical protein n=1 Tax=unclassified Mycobacteroides TaxID=2618759 RepID=UPI00132A541B|nr:MULTISPECIES: hypothetical protein [unclassified Mycobacteroides]MUM19559.1 hypothetical protein [Mycobacteroides sp. CBMA 326]MUM24161.1 hypothetical protein [Mycobacteroides sp. CBMA 271]